MEMLKQYLPHHKHLTKLPIKNKVPRLKVGLLIKGQQYQLQIALPTAFNILQLHKLTSKCNKHIHSYFVMCIAIIFCWK
ncbi:unnamed protein product [Paramecium octaurelia]|uniref:Uncharacterized protein n=1 Tax=Paramecium octaurelia TaxID=43137 RepID=A0A8S1VYU4_PAROT|nr:unnamed protein product [Paramecium octaurelia]